MRTETTQHLTADEITVLRKSLDNLYVCDICGDQIFNDGHHVTDDWSTDTQEAVFVYVVCDTCYDGQMKEAELA